MRRPVPSAVIFCNSRSQRTSSASTLLFCCLNRYSGTLIEYASVLLPVKKPAGFVSVEMSSMFSPSCRQNSLTRREKPGPGGWAGEPFRTSVKSVYCCGAIACDAYHAEGEWCATFVGLSPSELNVHQPLGRARRCGR